MSSDNSDKLAERTGALTRVVDHMIEVSAPGVTSYVQKLRSQNPGISSDALAGKIVRRKSFKNGLVGAVTGLGGAITLPIAIPVDVIASWKIQIAMALAIAAAYGRNNGNSDLKTDVFLILAGDSAKEALKRAGIHVAKGVTHKAIQQHVTREVMKKIWKVIPQRIITKAGEKSVLSLTRMVPIVGAPVGFAFDWAAARAVGRAAKRYYAGGG